MNLKTAQIKRQVTRKKKNIRVRKRGSISLLLLKIFCPIALLFCMAASMAWLNSESEKLNLSAIRIKTELNRLDRKIADMNIKCESLKGRTVLGKISYFNLNLHLPSPGQVKKLTSNNKVPHRLYRYRSNSRLLSQK